MSRGPEPQAFSRAHLFKGIGGIPAHKPKNEEDQVMYIERTRVGSITIDGKTYEHDVVIRLSGEGAKITAELPGMEENDIEVNVYDDVLTIKGEKKEAKEEKKKDHYVSERHYGSFHRSFHIPDSIDANKIEASFRNGLLTVTLPKTAQGQKRAKNVEVKKG
jgi:HSP20 family molecular chaperone IbpA